MRGQSSPKGWPHLFYGLCELAHTGAGPTGASYLCRMAQANLISGAGKAVGDHIPPTALFFCGAPRIRQLLPSW
jgi:hypothetical protein